MTPYDDARKNAIFKRVHKIISDGFDISPDIVTHLKSFEVLNMDSLDMVEFAIDLEEEFSLNNPVPERDFYTVDDVVKYLDKRIKGDIE